MNYCRKVHLFIEWLHGWWCWQRITFSKMCIWWQYPQEITASKQKFSPINFSSSSNKKEIPVRATPPPSPERKPLSAVKPTHCSNLVGIMLPLEWKWLVANVSFYNQLWFANACGLWASTHSQTNNLLILMQTIATALNGGTEMILVNLVIVVNLSNLVYVEFYYRNEPGFGHNSVKRPDLS